MLTIKQLRKALKKSILKLDPESDLVKRTYATVAWRKNKGSFEDDLSRGTANGIITRGRFPRLSDATDWDLQIEPVPADFLPRLAEALGALSNASISLAGPGIESKSPLRDQTDVDAFIAHALEMYWRSWNLGLGWDPW